MTYHFPLADIAKELNALSLLADIGLTRLSIHHDALPNDLEGLSAGAERQPAHALMRQALGTGFLLATEHLRY